MSIDLNVDWSTVDSKTKAVSETAQVLKDNAKLAQESAGDFLQQTKDKVTSTIDEVKTDLRKKFQRETKTQMDHMFDTILQSKAAGSSTFKYLKRKFVQTAVRIKPKILEILNQETIKALGCSQQQAYVPQIVYIKVKSVDLTRLLRRNPTEEVPAAAYEKTAPTPNQIPYSMNRELWDRLQNLNQPISFFGASGQELFKITYVDQDNNGISGEFYKVELVDRVTGANTISSFIVDYYKSINVVDTSNIFLQLMDMITGAFSFELNVGFGELDDKNKFLLLLQRILGLCFDSKREIDVGGNAKVPELDGIDDSFFEFSSMELRNLETLINNVQSGVIEFEDCQNVKLPVPREQIIKSVLDIYKVTKIEDEENLAEKLTEALTNNEEWKFLIPNSVDINLAVDLSFLKNLPKAIVLTLLSPKVLLPLFVMAKALGQLIGQSIENFLQFIKAFSKYVINLMSKIGAIFIQELFDIIKKDILLFLAVITKDLAKEKATKKLAMILKLVQLIIIVYRFVDDWRKCKSVVDEILALINLALPDTSNIPTTLLLGAGLCEGVSAIRSLTNSIEEFQKIGLPTGPMPDGSPNLMLQSILSSFKGLNKEQAENGKTQVAVGPLTVTPAGITMISGKNFGKSF